MKTACQMRLGVHLFQAQSLLFLLSLLSLSLSPFLVSFGKPLRLGLPAAWRLGGLGLLPRLLSRSLFLLLSRLLPLLLARLFVGQTERRAGLAKLRCIHCTAHAAGAGAGQLPPATAAHNADRPTPEPRQDLKQGGEGKGYSWLYSTPALVFPSALAGRG